MGGEQFAVPKAAQKRLETLRIRHAKVDKAFHTARRQMAQAMDEMQKTGPALWGILCEALPQLDRAKFNYSYNHDLRVVTCEGEKEVEPDVTGRE